MRPLLLLAYAAAAGALHTLGGATLRPALPKRERAPVAIAALPPTGEFLAEAVEEVGPVLYTQLATVGALLGSGFALDAEVFGFEVEEPSEEGAEEGAVDIYRDSLLRYLGYANEVGEAFRPLVPVELVYISYVAAISYILADTIDKSRKGAVSGGIVAGTLGGMDTFCWQMLASVLFPSFCINRVVTLLASLQEVGDLPGPLMAEWVPTVTGLVMIPLIILPLDVLAHFVMNRSFRRVSAEVLD